MFFKYFAVFLASLGVDIVPLPLPPAFVMMIFFQIYFKLDMWTVIFVGVSGSILGRYLLTLYIPKLSTRLFNPAKNEDVQFLGKKLKEKGWKSQVAIISYSLLPLPTTPLFIASGMARVKPYRIIPAFIIGKFTSDAITVFAGKYATENAEGIIKGVISWQSISGCILGVLLLTALLFIDWRTWLQQKKFNLNFKIWK
jgi:membrane protein YqaA with SNARE-associated domain